MPFPLNLIFRLNICPININQLTLKITQRSKISRNNNLALRKKSKVEGLLCHLKTFLLSTVVKTAWFQQRNRQIGPEKRADVLDIDSYALCELNFFLVTNTSEKQLEGWSLFSSTIAGYVVERQNSRNLRHPVMWHHRERWCWHSVCILLFTKDRTQAHRMILTTRHLDVLKSLHLI